MIVVIRISGQVDVDEKRKSILNAFGLKKKYSCILIKDESQLPVLLKIKDLVAYGELDEKLLENLKKRSKGKYFALHPPIGGLRKSSKLPWPQGLLGNERKEINKLLERMI